jgi:arabinogalactan oligomer/maltooligosaccharide transport system substrate-binding protein
MKVGRRFAVLLAVVLVTALALVVSRATSPASAAHAKASAKTVVIWTDSYRKAAVDKVTSQWGTARGVNITVVVKPFGNIQGDLTNTSDANAPDVIVGAHDWTGAMAANGSVVPIVLKKTVKKQFPAYSLAAESYGGREYGLPTQLENVGLVVNTSLVKIPKTFAQLEKEALAYKARSSGNIAIAVPQGSGGDAYHMYPFFSGLCGYVFAKSGNGALNPNKLGIANPKFLKNSALIDKWNREGLIDSKVDYGTAKNGFLNKKAAFWITGPWETEALNSSGIKFRIIQVPKIKCRAVPFLGVQGFYVTKFAAGHGVDSLAKDLVANYMSKPSAQYDLAIANSRFPANRLAGKRVHDAVLAQFGKAGAGGVPMPNIPQMGSVWADLGGAWVKATKGAGATKASVAFSTAARNIAAKIAGG